MVRFVFLGTSAGVPTPTRNVTALALQLPGSKYWSLVDCGEGTQRQLMQSPCKIGRIDNIFITHMHADHILGLPGLLQTRALLGLEKEAHPLHIRGPKGLREFLRLAQLDPTVTNQKLAGVTIEEWEEGKRFEWELGAYSVAAVPLCHSVASCAYLWCELNPPRALDLAKLKERGITKGPLFNALARGETINLPDGSELDGTIFREPPQAAIKFCVGGDNADPLLLVDELEGAQLLIHEATYLDEDFKRLTPPRPLHSSAASLAAAATQAKIPNLIMTHFSPRYKDAEAVERLREEALAHYCGHLALASDFALFQLTREGHLSELK